MSKLTQLELERYARHIVLRDVGGSGQQKLKSARVLVIGAGGLGSPAIAYLAAAGVGTIGIVDDDRVSLSNLQRQILHDTKAVGMRKTESAERSAERINPHIRVEAWPVRLDEANARALIALYELVIDGSDNFDTRYLVADRCEELQRILISAAVGQFDASITTLKPHLRDAEGRQYPRYRDLFPQKPPPGVLPTCAEAGILGALTGVVGSLQALEAIKEILGIGESLAGRILLYDALGARFETVAFSRSD